MQYIFTGCVQGVGFRYRAYHAAHLLGITGWVRNEFDGSVTMQAQGEARNLDAMIQMIEKGSYVAVDRVDSKKMPLYADENSFKICG
jgi:acylphosphatase